LKAQLGLVVVAGYALVAASVHRGIERRLQRAAGLRVHLAADQPLHQPRALRQLRVEQLLDLMTGVAVAAPGNQAQRDQQGAEQQGQGALADRALQHLSTR